MCRKWHLSQTDGAGQQSKPAAGAGHVSACWCRLALVVAVAIVCVVVAALMSAQRADDVALERERQLLARPSPPTANGRSAGCAPSSPRSASVSADDIDQSPALVQQRLSVWLGPLSDHDLVLVLNSANEIAYSQHGQDAPDLKLNQDVFLRLQSIAEYRARPRAIAARRASCAWSALADGSVLLHNFDGPAALSTAMPVRNPGSDENGSAAVRSC